MGETRNELTLIPKTERYMQYMIELIIKLPRTEKYSIGNEYKISMYKMLENILMLSKISDDEKLGVINKIDARIKYTKNFLKDNA